MQTCSRQHRIARAIPVLSAAAALLALCYGGISIAAVTSSSRYLSPTLSSSKQSKPKLAGTWSGNYSGAASGTFTLRWTQSGSSLSGTIKLSKPRGTYPIKGTLRGSTISFGSVGVGTTYSGTVSGRSMSGRWKSGNASGRWSARKIS